MGADEFKNVGSYFGEEKYVTVPGALEEGPACTVEGWFIWMSGDGPLLRTADGQWRLLYDRDGFCAYAIGDVERITTVPVASIQNRWIYAAIAKEGPDAILRIDDSVEDHWQEAPSQANPLGESFFMKDAVGFAADIAFYDKRLPDDRIDAHWEAGKNRV